MEFIGTGTVPAITETPHEKSEESSSEVTYGDNQDSIFCPLFYNMSIEFCSDSLINQQRLFADEIKLYVEINEESDFKTSYFRKILLEELFIFEL